MYAVIYCCQYREELLLLVQVLWPYLLELLVIDDYSESVGILSRSIHNIASRKRSGTDADYNIDFVIHCMY